MLGMPIPIRLPQVTIVALCLGSCCSWAVPIPFEELKKRALKCSPSGLVEYGLHHDRQWVIDQLLRIVETAPKDVVFSGKRYPMTEDWVVSALYYLELHGDASVPDRLEAIANRLRDPEDAGMARNTVVELRGKFITDLEKKYEYWAGVLRDGNVSTRRAAMEALGDLGDRRALGEFARLSAEFRRALSTASWEDRASSRRRTRLEADSAAFHPDVPLAMEKIRLLSTMSRVQAYAKAARGAPRKELFNDRYGHRCPLKIWGIKKLGELATSEALDVLEDLFWQYDGEFKRLLAVAKGRIRQERELAARMMFAANGQSDYYYLIHQMLLKAGRPPGRNRPVAAWDSLRRIED